MMQEYVLGIVTREYRGMTQVLLGIKQEKIGAGLWNGPGGKIEPGQTSEEALLDECRTEAGIIPVSYCYRGKVEYRFDTGKVLPVHFFHVTSYSGEVGNGNQREMKHWRWWNETELPYEKMMEADKRVFPLVLAGNNVRGVVNYTTQEPKPKLISLELYLS